jgi:hypothetical protein
MSAFLFGDYRQEDHSRYLGAAEDHSVFFARAEAARIKQQFRNRARLRLVLSKLLKLRIPFALDIENSNLTETSA